MADYLEIAGTLLKCRYLFGYMIPAGKDAVVSILWTKRLNAEIVVLKLRPVVGYNIPSGREAIVFGAYTYTKRLLACIGTIHEWT